MFASDYSIGATIILLTSADIKLRHKRTPLVAPIAHEVLRRAEVKRAFGDAVIARVWAPPGTARIDWAGM